MFIVWVWCGLRDGCYTKPFSWSRKKRNTKDGRSGRVGWSSHLFLQLFSFFPFFTGVSVWILLLYSWYRSKWNANVFQSFLITPKSFPESFLVFCINTGIRITNEPQNTSVSWRIQCITYARIKWGVHGKMRSWCEERFVDVSLYFHAIWEILRGEKFACW